MGKIVALTGNDAAGTAMIQIRPDVVAAFPITPQTELMHKFAEAVADGDVDTEFVSVESEHSAMSAAIGASAAGARVMTATAANGFALMWEVVYIAASYRLPIVMTLVNRALSGPINIHCDHSDSMGGRDAGWIQLHSENSQEVYDNLIQGVKIAENRDVLLPVMVTSDGFILSHTLERMEILDNQGVQDFVGENHPQHTLLDVDHPITFGPLDLPDYYFEHKRQQVLAMEKAKGVILEVGREFKKLSGRDYWLFEEYQMEGAERAIVALGSTAGTVKETVDALREKGEKVGLIKLRVFRPFPKEELVEALKGIKALVVLDRSNSFGGFGGPLFTEIRSTLYGSGLSFEVLNYIYGLGGRNISLKEIEGVYSDLKEVIDTSKVKERINYLGVRE